MTRLVALPKARDIMSDGSWKRMFGFVETQHLESLSLNAMLALIPVS